MKDTKKSWKIKLRKQVTDIEHFNISCVDDALCPGEYIVRNPEKNNEYKVVYRGANSEWNYCSCMDFKTSRLGTCKHIEAFFNIFAYFFWLFQYFAVTLLSKFEF